MTDGAGLVAEVAAAAEVLAQAEASTFGADFDLSASHVDDYELPALPFWRDSGHTLQEMLDVVRKLSRTVQATDAVLSTFRRLCAVRYVFTSNQLELLGTDTYEDTVAAIEGHLETTRATGAKIPERKCAETRQTFYALQALVAAKNANRSDLKLYTDATPLEALSLCEDLVQRVHNVLLHGNASDIHGGDYRETIVYADEERPHFYPPPVVVAPYMTALIDRFNHHLRAFTGGGDDLAYRFHLAAWLLYHFVSLHPFRDGNGRMCRLLANWVLDFPFAVPFSITGTSASPRDVYLDSIRRCRSHRNPDGSPEPRRPVFIVAVLIESAYFAWTDYARLVHSQQIDRPLMLTVHAGLDQTEIAVRLRRIDAGATEADVQRVRAAAEATAAGESVEVTLSTGTAVRVVHVAASRLPRRVSAEQPRAAE